MNARLNEEILEWLASPRDTEVDALLAVAQPLDDYEFVASAEAEESELVSPSHVISYLDAPLPTNDLDPP